MAVLIFFDNAEGYEAGESEKIMGECHFCFGFTPRYLCVVFKVFWGGDKQMQLALVPKHVRGCRDCGIKTPYGDT